MASTENYDLVIVGAGIIGLATAREWIRRYPDSRVCVLEKEPAVARHASGRNSGVLHAGFYYSADSLKARFTLEGNRLMAAYCEEHGLPINRCGKVVVATDAAEVNGLHELKRRAERNGVPLQWVDERELIDIDPNAKTVHRALYSPLTATVDPERVCETMRREIADRGVAIKFATPFRQANGNTLKAGNETIRFGYLINAAGLYADKIAHGMGFGHDYEIIPFKGLYLKYEKNKSDVRTNIYPVPNLNNPFLGVHFTKTVDGSIKIGPTATPAFWRENYRGMAGFRAGEFLKIAGSQSRLLAANAFGYRRLALEEMKKYVRSHFIALAARLVKRLDPDGFGGYMRPGIRAQLLDRRTRGLVQDFVVEGDHRSLHVLNAVSPAFTCSIPFARHLVSIAEQKQGGTTKHEAG
jgi:L-2-hydroxyglutarate oxidase LhgO